MENNSLYDGNIKHSQIRQDMAPKLTTTEKQVTRINAIRELLSRIPTHADPYEYDDSEAGRAFGYRKFGRELSQIMANTEQTPKETLTVITRTVSRVPAEFTADPNDRDSTEFNFGTERGEILLAKQIRRILNSPVPE